METMATLLGILCVLAMSLAGFFATFILPIWGIIQVAGSQRSGGEKAGWIIGILATGGLVSLVYGLFAAAPGLRTTTRFFFVVFIMSLATSFGVAFYLGPIYAEREAASQAARLDESTFDVQPGEQETLQQDSTLQQHGFEATIPVEEAADSGA